jgi:hypothetical protein
LHSFLPLFVLYAPTFGAAGGKRAQAAVEFGFEFAEEAVAGEGAAGLGVEA